MAEGGIFEEIVASLRSVPLDESDSAKAYKVADDLVAMDLAMVAITGEGDGAPPTIFWHNTALEFLMDALEEMEQASFFQEAASGRMGLETMRLIHRKSMELAFMIGHELGEGEYQIDQHDIREERPH
jgi:hypothetical protein